MNKKQLYLVTLARDDRKLEHNVLSGKLAVHLAKSVNFVVNTSTVLGVKEDLDNLVAILLCAHTLADNLGGEYKVGQDGVVDRGESPGARTLLLDTTAAARQRENTALCHEHNMAVREFLLKLTGKSNIHH